MPPSHKGLHELFNYPLMSAIFDRRTRRVARGTSVVSGPISHTSTNKPAPLSPLEEAILVAANFGDDSDTTAAVCGQVAGAYYGERGIPPRWLDRLAMRSTIATMADQLARRPGS